MGTATSRGSRGGDRLLLLIQHQAELGLTGEQVSALNSIREAFKAETAPLNEKMRKAYRELGDLMREDRIDVAKGEALVDQIAALRAQWGKLFVEAIAKGKEVLTSRQLEKAREIWSRGR